MMKEMMDVADFHRKMGISSQRQLRNEHRTEEVDLSLRVAAHTLSTLAQQFERQLEAGSDDRRVLRAHLLLEELSEFLDAIAICDELGTLDALADLLYVLLGSAVTMDLPLWAAFIEVHTSNMTKEKQPDDAASERIRKKGPNYRPPNLAKILYRYRHKGDILLICGCGNHDSHAPRYSMPRCSAGCGRLMREATPAEYELEVKRGAH